MARLGSRPPQVEERKAWEPEAPVADVLRCLGAVQATLSNTSQARNVWAVHEASVWTAGTLVMDGEDKSGEGEMGTGSGVCGSCFYLSI